ncbi:MAG: tetratricopeptide repeat protein [Gemmatimonadetes bacterium]|nr:tetratricopeptide repeat protein [Gemmatimonadota bacterium]
MLGLLVAAVLVGRLLVHRAVGRSATPSVAVLPCTNLTTDPENEYLSDGMAEDLINVLSQVEGLRVPGRESSFSLRESGSPVREAGERLGVSAALECSVRQARDSLRVGVRLVNVADGYQMWGETFVREAKDIFAVQQDVVRGVIAHLAVRPEVGASPVARGTKDPQAYDFYARGRFFWNQRTQGGIAKSIEYFSRAIERDSGYALAYAGLADAYAEAAARYSRRQDYPLAERAARKAVALDDSLAEVHASLGKVLAAYRWDLRGAERELQRAIALNPKYGLAHSWYGLWALMPMGRFDDAIHEASLGVELEPLAPATQTMLGNVLYHARRYEQAVAVLLKGREMAPELASTRGWLGLTYAAMGRFEEALTVLQAGDPSLNQFNLGALGYAYARAGRREEALKIVAQLRARQDLLRWSALGRVYAGLGERDQALTALEKAFGNGPVGNSFSLVDPSFVDALGSEPRFVQLLKRLGLEQ